MATGAGWRTVKDYGNVTVPAGAVLCINYDAHSTGVSYHEGAVRLKLGSLYAHADGGLTASWVTYRLYVILTAGTYDVLVEGYCAGGDRGVAIRNMKVGYATIPDTATTILAAYSSTITLNLASRKTVAGIINRTNLHIFAYAVTPSNVTAFENVGDNFTNGVSLSVDGSQASWTDRFQDNWTDYGGASAHYSAGNITLDANHTVAFSKRNADTTINVTIVITPWLLSDDSDLSNILLLDFPQGSTLYIVTEPLTANPTVNIKFGKVRAITYGASTDYFYSASGTGILVGSYSFETPNPSDLCALVYGYGALIARILLDVR